MSMGGAEPADPYAPCRGPNGEALAPPESSYDENASVRAFPAWSPKDRDFDVVHSLAVGSAMDDWQRLAAFDIPQGCEGTFLWWGHDCTDTTAFLSVQFRVGVTQDYRLVYPAVAQLATLLPGNFCPVYICGRGGQTFFIEAFNPTANGPFTIRTRIKGLYRMAPIRIADG